MGIRAEMKEEEDEEDDKKGGKYRETPRVAHVEVVICGGGYMPPLQRKTRAYLTLPQNVRTCYCRESMETTRITTMGRAWTEESQTTLSVSVVGAG